MRYKLIFTVTYNTVVAVHVQVLIVSLNIDVHIHWNSNWGSLLNSYFCSFEANLDLYKMWEFHISKSECLGLLPLSTQRQWDSYYPKGILILSVIHVYLSSPTRRREKSLTSKYASCFNWFLYLTIPKLILLWLIYYAGDNNSNNSN